MKRTYVYDPVSKEMVEVTHIARSDVEAPMVWGDVKPFVSPATGECISDRGQLRRHMQHHGLAPADEMRGTAERVRRERAARERAERHRAVRESYEHVRNQERAKARFG